MFETLQWHDDRAVFNGITFFLEGRARPVPVRETDGLWLHKDRALLEAYDRLFSEYSVKPRLCLELGIWKGGSAVLWMEALRPDKFVAVDIAAGEDPPALRRYVDSRSLGGRLRLYWRTDQADSERLLAIWREEFAAPLDLVIDDASHAYAPTRASFETLFPLLREGGLYIVEDWAWKFSPHFRADFAADEPGLQPLIGHLSVLTIGVPGLIQRLDVRRPFFVVERGPLAEAEARAGLAAFALPAPAGASSDGVAMGLRRLKRRLSRLLRGPIPGP